MEIFVGIKIILSNFFFIKISHNPKYNKDEYNFQIKNKNNLKNENTIEKLK